ncbi:MAG: GTP cyclohydrolase I [Acidobacteriota bacterium]|nr:GTP cyclohydrolase I [Blastocatellia bacterium]MDW8240699.1 GTP cyclohydrolase I [Acidobacteriota bacterium]
MDHESRIPDNEEMTNDKRQETSEQIAQRLREIIRLLGLNEADPELQRTPERIARLYAELFCGVSEPPPDISVTDNPHLSGEMILIRDLPFHSMCIHHFIPFFGAAHVAYVPREKIAGLSSIARVLRHFASQPQLQERMTNAIADHIQATLQPEGVIVHVRARHLCMEMRGERVPGWVETTAARWVFQKGPLRDEFFARLKNGPAV